MIAYQVPAVMRHLTPLQIIDEGVSGFTAVGIFAYLASVGGGATSEELWRLSQTEHHDAIRDALHELEGLQLIEQVKITGSGDIDGMLADLSGEVSA